MNRKIYRFYCYHCNTLNASSQSYPLDVVNNKIVHVHCPNCCSWIHYSNTNLVPDRFKIIRKDRWGIVDEDALNPVVLYTSENYGSIIELCNSLNNNTLTSETFNNHLAIFEVVEWYVNLL